MLISRIGSKATGTTRKPLTSWLARTRRFLTRMVPWNSCLVHLVMTRRVQKLTFPGIKRTGSSHLLLADIQAYAFEQRGKKRPYRCSTIADFESVSPIYFNSLSDLKKKFGVLKPKATKKKQEEPFDTSQANKPYTAGDQGILRGVFENGR
jgi:hypothetical protein